MAVKSISGTLASLDLVAALAPAGTSTAGLRTVLSTARRTIGPSSGARLVMDAQVLPLVRALGLDVHVLADDAQGVVAAFGPPGGSAAGLLSVGGWGADLRRLRERAAAREPGPRWWVGANGATLRVMDGTRAFTRRVLDFDLQRAEEEDAALAVLRQLFVVENDRLSSLDRLIAQSLQHRVDVGRSLQSGVERALDTLVAGFGRGRRRVDADLAFADALTIVYRILFLLFAEARGLVPQWHPIYRESYTIESLRPIAESHGPPTGLWESLQAISRLAHRGCTAGALRVVPFNGRLFAPASAPLADSFKLDDHAARDVLLAVTTRAGVDRRERIAYGDLGVEQLGAVYERVLDFTPGGAQRKSSGTFYTPRAMTEYLVRRTLAPLVHGRTSDQILALRVVDPAMGSGAFLVAACRYLADAYEAALAAEGRIARADLTAPERASFRRTVAQRCLYGVDINPTAVQLARLSLWLCTLAADRPLTFLDHHLRTGNSLIGATAVDIARQPPGRGRAPRPLPLFEDDHLPATIASAIDARVAVALTPDDSAAAVRMKERTIDDLAGPSGALAVWRTIADAWCAAWFWPPQAPPLSARAWPSFEAALRGRHSDAPADLIRQWRLTAAAAAAGQRFFHWELEFPEIFFAQGGAPREDAGFDAVIGNPPWADAAAIAAFARESGCYRLQGRGHANLYQMFAERMLDLTRRNGRVGMLMPSGLLADHGCADLRRGLFDRFDVDAVLGLDNRDGLFPIHRALRFSLITATRGTPTRDLPMRPALRSAAALEDVPDRGGIPLSVRVPLTLVRRFSGEDLAVPEFATEQDRAIAARVLAAVPPLASEDGWNVRVGRELNATDDRGHFGSDGLPVLEGKHLEPFRADVNAATARIDARTAAALLGARSRIATPRLGYREVASASNRLTLIAAVIPADVVTTHTIFCAREPADEALQWYLCGAFNSFVANYLVRLRGGTHVPAATIHRLPVPVFGAGDPTFRRIAGLSRIAHADRSARAEIHARMAHAYGLGAADFAHVLATFPLIAEEERGAAFAAFRDFEDAI